jgi:SAM-dependent methyltransferase
MTHAGNLDYARNSYLKKDNLNLYRLLESRFSWMNNFFTESKKGLELGAGTGASKDFINSNNYYISDFNNSEWLDYKNVDALKTEFKDNEFDFLVCSNLIHHLAYPAEFFKECQRILKDDGLIIIQDIYSSLLMRFILKLMRHEGYNEEANVFNNQLPCNDPKDLWSANCSIPKLLFKSKSIFESHYKFFEIVHKKPSECLLFLNSGGVIAKTKYIPINKTLTDFVIRIDRLLVKILPQVFALQIQIVLRLKQQGGGLSK